MENVLELLVMQEYLSFSLNKTITTGQGGAILLDDDSLSSEVRLRELKDQGRPERGTGEMIDMIE